MVFSTALRSFADPSTAQGSNGIGSTTDIASVRTWLMGELSECMKIYEMLERWDAAEDVFRQEVVAPFVKRVSVYEHSMS